MMAVREWMDKRWMDREKVRHERSGEGRALREWKSSEGRAVSEEQ